MDEDKTWTIHHPARPPAATTTTASITTRRSPLSLPVTLFYFTLHLANHRSVAPLHQAYLLLVAALAQR